MPYKPNLFHPEYRSDINGMRAIAVLSVIIYHVFPNTMKGGFIGVDVFFVISGYLISLIIIKSLDNNNFTFIAFYFRRIRRIFPALIVVLVVTMIVGWIILFAY
jgi:peptidoglycan/LPS O-acetylase OafA/YrhL